MTSDSRDPSVGDGADARTPVARPAPTAHEILPVLRDRWSARAIDPHRGVAHADVAALLEAARWTPSSGNAQPWRFVVYDDTTPAQRTAARDCLRPGNAWARRAPVLVLGVVRRWWPGSRDDNPSARHDVGAAALALCLQATALGLVAHQMAGFDRTRARRIAALPDGVDPATFIAVGHPGRVDALPSRARERERAPRRREPLSRIARRGGWEGPSWPD